MNLAVQVTQVFEDRFGEEPRFIVRAPGRVNLIGEHTDYNLGYSLPMAIDRAMWIGLRPRNDERVVLHSLEFPEPADFLLTEIQHTEDWSEYVRGMSWALQRADFELQGWEGVVLSDVPVASGLSSSAALELVVARAFWALSRWDWDDVQMADIAKQHENEWMGLQSGIMDQMISAIGKQGKAFLLDFKDLSSVSVSMPESTVIVVMNTKVPRGLVDSAYNERVKECKQAAEYFGVESLRELDLKIFEAQEAGLDEVLRKRTRHIITANQRALDAVKCMEEGDEQALGKLMFASHISLRDDYEVSCKELDLMVDLAMAEAGCLGARMTGGGFGGCAIALVEAGAAEALAERVARQYQAQSNIEPEIYICLAADGANLIK